MTAWDELLAVTHPGTEVENPTTAERWLVLRRSYASPDLLAERDRMTLTVEFVRAGSDSDPRRPPGDAPAALTAEEVRAQVDAMCPRIFGDGRINTQHVAIEQTLRERNGLPSYVPELDGPGRFAPRPTQPEG